jgi:hypothetical protein
MSEKKKSRDETKESTREKMNLHQSISSRVDFASESVVSVPSLAVSSSRREGGARRQSISRV